MLRSAPLLVALAIAAALSACATGPHERTVRAQFACDDGRKLQVTFNLDRELAQVRLSRKEIVDLPSTHPANGRAFAADGYALTGVGDTVTFATPTSPAVRCLETR